MSDEKKMSAGRTDAGSFLQAVMTVLEKGRLPVRDRYFRDQTRINLDGKEFENCCFENCTLFTNDGTFRLKDCVIRNCTLAFGQSAAMVIRLLYAVEPPPARIPQHLLPLRDGDRVSIVPRLAFKPGRA